MAIGQVGALEASSLLPLPNAEMASTFESHFGSFWLLLRLPRGLCRLRAVAGLIGVAAPMARRKPWERHGRQGSDSLGKIGPERERGFGKVEGQQPLEAQQMKAHYLPSNTVLINILCLGSSSAAHPAKQKPWNTDLLVHERALTSPQVETHTLMLRRTTKPGTIILKADSICQATLQS